MPDLQKEIAEAKRAVRDFVAIVFRPMGVHGGKEWGDAVHRMEAMCTAERIQSGESLGDYVSPSFWHACCEVLYLWVHAQLSTGYSLTYRGQTNPWPVRPTLWRAPEALRQSGSAPLAALLAFIRSKLPREADPGYEYFAFDSDESIAALAQHHHFPTNLIDFTFHPLVALHFASRRSDRAALGRHPMEGHGVIHQTTFTNFSKLQARAGIRPVLHVVPPLHVFRLHQQRGFLLDFGPETETETEATANRPAQLNAACKRFFFDGEYPDCGDADEVFGEDEMMRWLRRVNDPFHSRQAAWMNEEWYLAYPFYQKAIGALRKYCDTRGAQFDQTAAVRAMTRATRNDLPPWDNYAKSFISRPAQSLNLAENLSHGLQFVIEAALVFTPMTTRVEADVLRSYVRANPAMFAAAFETAKNVDAFQLRDLWEIINLNVPDVYEMIKGALTAAQQAELENLVPITQGTR